MKRSIVLGATLLLAVLTVSGCKKEDPAAAANSNSLVVYNWGEYIDPDILDQFEEETGISIIYDEFETNEIMYPKVETGAVVYDVICPSDYMIQKMIENDLLEPLDYDKIPNISNIDPDYLKSAEQFDPGNRYCVPYCWGTVGILYNKTMVHETVDSWDILWDEKYKDEILMQDSVRDAFPFGIPVSAPGGNFHNGIGVPLGVFADVGFLGHTANYKNTKHKISFQV